MAQTKTKQKKASQGSKSRSKSRSRSASKAKSVNSTKQKTAAKPSAASNGASASNGIAQTATRAKVPLVAGGAALIGAAGGLAYGASHSGDKVMGIRMPGSKRVRFKSRDLRKAASEVGHFGDRVGKLTKELRKTREETDGSIGGPVEVLVRSLARRR